METDGSADMKTRECTEGVAKVVQAMHGDSFSAKRIQDGPQGSTTFGEKVEPLALPCRDDAVVENGCGAQVISLTLEDAHNNSRRWLTPRRKNYYSDMDDLRPANFLVLWFYLTKEKTLRTSTSSTLYDSSF